SYATHLIKKYGSDYSPKVTAEEEATRDILDDNLYRAQQALQNPKTRAAQAEQMVFRAVAAAKKGDSRVITKPGLPPAIAVNWPMLKYLEARLGMWDGFGGVSIQPSEAAKVAESLTNIGGSVAHLAYARTSHLLPTKPEEKAAFESTFRSETQKIETQ